jgi:hypothetical protein
LRTLVRFPRQLLDRKANLRQEAIAASVPISDYFGTHSWVPEFLEVIGRSGNSVFRPLALEEPADLVRHHN